MIRLNEKERLVLAAVQLQPHISFDQLAAKIGMRVHTVRYLLHQMEQRGVIHRRALINPTAAGFSVFHLLLSLAPPKQGGVTALTEFLKAHPRIADLNAVGGDFQYEMQFLGGAIEDLGGFLDSITSKFGLVLREREISIFRSFVFVGSKWLSSGRDFRARLGWQAVKQAFKVDLIDLKLLNILSEGVRSERELARSSGLAASTVAYRLDKLRESKLIVGDFYEIRSETVGSNSYLVFVYTKGVSPDLDQRILDFCADHLAIDAIARGIGSWDYLLQVQADIPINCNLLSQDLEAQFESELRFVRVIPRLGNLKYSPFPVGVVADQSPSLCGVVATLS